MIRKYSSSALNLSKRIKIFKISWCSVEDTYSVNQCFFQCTNTPMRPSPFFFHKSRGNIAHIESLNSMWTLITNLQSSLVQKKTTVLKLMALYKYSSLLLSAYPFASAVRNFASNNSRMSVLQMKCIISKYW